MEHIMPRLYYIDQTTITHDFCGAIRPRSLPDILGPISGEDLPGVEPVEVLPVPVLLHEPGDVGCLHHSSAFTARS